MKYQYNLICRIHDLPFGFGDKSVVDHAMCSCPLCAWEENQKLRAELETVKTHRKMLLAAIEIKQTVQIANVYGEE